MRIRHALLGAATVAVLAACGTSTASPQDAAPTTAPPTTTTTVVPTTTTKPTTTTTTARPTTTKSTTTRPTTTTKRPPATTTKPTTTKPKPVGLAKGTPCKATADACIDLSANKSWLIEDGVAVYGPVPITHGRPGWETPPGTFQVGWKNRHHRSSIFNNAPMPYSVFFNGGIAFHEGSLQEQSHGCIHLSRTAAAKYFAALQVGDVVQVVR
ncbi:L,D-transpeptidase [Actinokineospora fastidiosa]|uniref:L,D-TPase catalytic domain-containing protein n=1 Tax=Actinokineospora fastidiosa TaxID=1816 RepID=A0A918L6A3_9PSEU|nr:L,D-transpeptidase [Actinokineospora fastidiosa]GGS13817.1 hypothetical protein GCM10010171_02070 [Actinokineospora fastidiosa]